MCQSGIRSDKGHGRGAPAQRPPWTAPSPSPLLSLTGGQALEVERPESVFMKKADAELAAIGSALSVSLAYLSNNDVR
jgi:hypothetical protein